MDHRVKEECHGRSRSSTWYSSANVPQPMEGLHDSGPPPFLTKTYEIVEDSNTNHIVSWSRGYNSFVVWDPQAFAMNLLPKYFKHNNFSSFVRQLNTYGFRKVDPDRWEFANEGFLRGQKHLLKNIRRRRNPQGQSSQNSLDPVCVEVGRFGFDGEIDRLRRDKQVLMMELVKLRQQQQNTKASLQLMEGRLKRTEAKQQHMMSFLARAMRNPNFVQHLLEQKDLRKELEGAISKKRRRSIDQGPSGGVDDVEAVASEFGNVDDQVGTFIKIEPEELGDLSEFEVSQLDQLAMNMQGLEEDIAQESMEGYGGNKGKEAAHEQGLWEDLLNEDIAEEIGILAGDEVGDDEEHVNVLVQQLGYLSSSPK